MKKIIKQNKLAAIGIIIIVLFLFCLLMSSIFKNKDINKPNNGDISQSTPNSQLQDTPIEEQSNDFEEMSFDVENTMQDSAGYFQQFEHLEWGKERKKSYHLVPTANSDGSKNMAVTGHTIYSGDTGDMFIISGVNPVEYVSGRIFGTDYLREEDTGVRIRTFNNQEEVDYFRQSYNSGRRILAGETDADEGTIIVDGCFTDIRYQEKNDTLYFNIVDVLKQIIPTTVYIEGSGALHVFPNEFITIQIPTDSATYQLKNSLAVSGGKFTFRSWNGERFEYTASVLNEKDMLMSAQDASVMFGWKMYSNGKVLSIVTDELNVTEKAVIYSFDGDNGYVFKVELGEDGKQYVNMYDSKGALLTSKPYTETEGSQTPEIASGSSSEQQVEKDIDNSQSPATGNKGGATWDDGYSM